jgi:MoaA/NifB/PqqE/SkfB family radical SAM enzyme
MTPHTFCVAPWTHSVVAVNSKLRPCCVSQQKLKYSVTEHDTWWNGEEMQQLRSDLLNGVQNTDCNHCWKSESLGRESLRQNYNKLFKSYIDFPQLRDTLKNNNLDNVTMPTTWELDIGNLCNLKCIMCDPTRSDKIQQEVIAHTTVFESFPVLVAQSQTETVTNWLDTEVGQDFLSKIKPNLKWLKLQGGESLAVRSIRDLIENLDASEVVLSIITNGTILDRRLLSALSKFKKVEISISIEAIGAANDVIRYGSNWEIIEKNIILLNKLSNVELQLNHVLQNTSTIFLPDVIKFAESNNLHLAVLPLSTPQYLSMSTVPTTQIKQLIQTVNEMNITHEKNKFIKTYLINVANSTQFDFELHNQFKNYVSALDSIRDKKLTPYVQSILNIL